MIPMQPRLKTGLYRIPETRKRLQIKNLWFASVFPKARDLKKKYRFSRDSDSVISGDRNWMLASSPGLEISDRDNPLRAEGCRDSTATPLAHPQQS